MHKAFRAMRRVVPGDVVLLSDLLCGRREDFVLLSSVTNPHMWYKSNAPS